MLEQMKKCFYCEKEFQVKTKGSGGQNRLFCYECYPEGLTRSERNKLRKKLFTQKASQEKIKRGCDICGYNKCGAALEWHHNKDNKEYNPGDLLKEGTLPSYEKYQLEIQKCQLVCANCHREIHYNLSMG